MLAATNLLRLFRCELIPQSLQETEHGVPPFQMAIDLMKRMSVAKDDIPKRCADILSQLWTSTKIFTRADGSRSPELRIRTRLGMSPVIDCLWWFREEFRGQEHICPQPQLSNQSVQG